MIQAIRSIALGGLAGLVIVTSYGCAEKPSIPTLTPTQAMPSQNLELVTDLTFEMVRAGIVTQDEHVAFLAEKMPELVAAKEAGWINAIYYKPSAKQMYQIATDYSNQGNQGAAPNEEIKALNH